MEKLHLRSPKSYDFSNEAESVPVRMRFYCVSEGATEESYFMGIRNDRRNLGIKNDVYIEVVKKQEGQETVSHPMQLVMACLHAMGRIDENGSRISKDNWNNYCKWEEFDPEIDKVCVIFDRDYRKLENTIDEIFELCRENGIRIVLSNPNFELWLLMHFPGIERYEPELLARNQKNLRHQLFEDASASKKYLEILLSKNAAGYTKGCRLKFESFLPLIDMAIAQAKLFCEDPRKIVDELGTSMGKLIEDMRLE